MVDVMWADPQNVRRLIAPTKAVAEFVDAIYAFDEVIIDPTLQASVTGNVFRVNSERLRFSASFGRPLPIPFGQLRRPFVTRFIEHPLARTLLGVNTFGTTSRGIREWYQADQFRRLTNATAKVDGEDAGAWGPVTPPLRVGFSEPPTTPSRVTIRPRLLDPTGHLDALVSRLQQGNGSRRSPG